MQSKNSLIVKNNIERYISQIIEQKDTTQEQLKQIDTLIESRGETLQTLVIGFEEFLQEYEKDHSKNKQWHKTLRLAKKYLISGE